MEVILLTSPASIKDMENFAALAYLTCHANVGNHYVPHEKLERAIKDKHESVLEHITLTYSVKGLSRACLQELARHRHISLSVESTRHTLDEIFDTWETSDDVPDLPQNVREIDGYGIYGNLRHCYLSELRALSVKENIPNDELKYYLPEFWPTNLILTSNIRELRHILTLRTSPAALNEFRVLAYSLFEAVPEDYRYLLEDCVYKEDKNAVHESKEN